MNSFSKEYTFDEGICLLLEKDDNKEDIILELWTEKFNITNLLHKFVIDNKTKRILKKESKDVSNEYLEITVDYLKNDQWIILNLLSDIVINKGKENYILKDIYEEYKYMMDFYNSHKFKDRYIKDWFNISILMDEDYYILYFYPTFEKILSFKKGSKTKEIIIN